MSKKIILAMALVIGVAAGTTSAVSPMIIDVTGSVGSGNIDVQIKGYNQGSNSPSGVLEGLQGSFHQFQAMGSFDITKLHSTVAVHGELHTEVQAASQSPADLTMYGWQDFEVSGGNPGSKQWIGELDARAMGTTSASMDIDMTGSMYIFKDHGPYTYPTTPSPNWMLKGEGADYDVWHETVVTNKNTSELVGQTQVELWQSSTVGPASGSASSTDAGMFGFSSAWAFETNNNPSTDYPNSTTMYMNANGAGNNWQYTYALNGGTHNGAAFGGPGSQTTSGWFTSGYSSNPSASAN